MNLTTEQVNLFWREWPKSCKAMGWTRANGMSAKEIDAKRKEFLARCGFDSLTKVDRLDGFTKVKNELLVLQGVSLKAAQETVDPALNQARVLRNVILTEIVPCLELYVPDVRKFITDIMEDKNRWWKIDRPVREMTLMDLDAKPIYRHDKKTGELREYPSQLKQMLYTLNDCLHGSGQIKNGKKKRLGFRVAAGHSVLEMRTKAGLESPGADVGYSAEETAQLNSAFTADPVVVEDADPVEADCQF